MKNTRWLSIRTLRSRQFLRSARRISSNDQSSADLYLLLGKIIQSSAKKIQVLCTTIVILLTILRLLSEEDTISGNLWSIPLNFPVHYLAVISTLAFFILIIQTQKCMMLLSVRGKLSERVLGDGVDPETLDVLNDQNDISPALSAQLNNSFHQVPLLVRVINLLTVLIVPMLLAVVLLTAWLICWNEVNLIKSENGLELYIAHVFSEFLLILSVLYLIYFNVPVPVKRNKAGIIGDFLKRAHARSA